VKRGWVGKYPYLSPNRQEAMLVRAGVEPRVIYRGRDEWEPFVRALRPGDEAMVADLTIFGSRKALGEASQQVADRNAVLVPVSSLTPIHHPTLADVQRTESKWAGHRSMGGSKRARELSKRALVAKREKIAAERMPEPDARAIYFDLEKYPLRDEAIDAMPGWSVMKAWRAFGPRESR
jgi:hypothetical protein